MAVPMRDVEAVRGRFALLAPALDERRRRLVAAAEALTLGWGGVAAVAQATGVSRRAIQAGIAELQAPAASRLPQDRIRRPGGGRTRTVVRDPALRQDLERLIDPVTRGDPDSALRWTCKSVRKLAGELQRLGHRVSHRLVAELLHEAGYSLQANRKTLEGGNHPDRDAQFAYLHARVQAHLNAILQELRDGGG